MSHLYFITIVSDKEWLRSFTVNALLFKSISKCYCTNNIVVTLMEFFTLFYHIWFYETIPITYAQFTFCLFSILFFQIPIYSIVTTCSFYFNSEKTSQRKSYQMLFAHMTGTPGVFLEIDGSWTFTFIPLITLIFFSNLTSVSRLMDYDVVVIILYQQWMLQAEEADQLERRKFCLPRCVLKL